MRFKSQAVTGQQRHGAVAFPLVLVAEGPMAQQDLRAQSAVLVEQLTTHGAILFRGCRVTDAQAFDDFVAGFNLPNFAYDESLSNAVRHNRTPRVFTANEAPQDVEIFLHHEMAQTPYYPSHLFFFCEQAAAAGGATPLCRSDVLLEKLTQHLQVRGVAEHTARCSLTMPAEADATSGRAGVGARRSMSTRKRQPRPGWQRSSMTGSGYLKTQFALLHRPCRSSGRRPPVTRSSLTSSSLRFVAGRISATSTRSVTHGDGSAFDKGDVQAAVEIAYDLVFDLPWESGDLALIDNYQVMHGRRPFSGQRSVLASLCLDSIAA